MDAVASLAVAAAVALALPDMDRVLAIFGVAQWAIAGAAFIYKRGSRNANHHNSGRLCGGPGVLLPIIGSVAQYGGAERQANVRG
jgi:hypothetical protein